MASQNARTAAAPILSLFRDILRLHRDKLAGPLKTLGNDYVRSEFRSHLRNAKTTRPQWEQFMASWKDYMHLLEGRGSDRAPMVNTSGELSEEVLEAMSEDQKARMQLLKKEVAQLGKKEEP